MNASASSHIDSTAKNMEQHPRCTKLHYESTNSTVYLVGCYHDSCVSRCDAREIIGIVKPEAVAVELCKERWPFIAQEYVTQTLNPEINLLDPFDNTLYEEINWFVSEIFQSPGTTVAAIAAQPLIAYLPFVSLGVWTFVRPTYLKEFDTCAHKALLGMSGDHCETSEFAEAFVQAQKSTSIRPMQADDDFYSNLRVGSKIDAIDKHGRWYNGEIIAAPGGLFGCCSAVKVRYRFYDVNGKHKDKHGQQYFGFGIEHDEWHEKISAQIMPLGTYAHNLLNVSHDNTCTQSVLPVPQVPPAVGCPNTIYLIDTTQSALFTRLATECLKNFNSGEYTWSECLKWMLTADDELELQYDVTQSPAVLQRFMNVPQKMTAIRLREQITTARKSYRAAQTEFIKVGLESKGIQKSIDIFAKYPWISVPLLDERNAIMTNNLHRICAQRPNETIVAFVGAAHVPGMVDLFGLHQEKLRAGFMNASEIDLEFTKEKNKYMESIGAATKWDYCMVGAAATTVVAAPPVTMGFGLRFLKRRYSTRAAGLAGVGILGVSVGYMALERCRYRSRCVLL
jgi:hypothetical protein